MNRLSVAPFRGRAAFQSAPEPSPTLRLRLHVGLHRNRLDRDLASGGNPEAGPELAFRARQLANPRKRRQIAKGLRGSVREAEAPRSPFGSAVPTRRDTTPAVRSALLGLAERLEGPLPVNPRGVALALALLTDGTGPLYYTGAVKPLDGEIWEIADALTPERGLSWSRVQLP